MEKYKIFSEKLSEEEFSKEFLEEKLTIEDFSKRYFEKFGIYPSKKLLKGIEIGLRGLKKVEKFR
jgi:hypothetical protein